MFKLKKERETHYLAQWIVHYFLILGVIDQIARATDYITGDIQTIGIIEISSNVPQTVWGGACFIAAAILTYGILSDNMRIQTVGCVISGAIYAGFAAVTMTRIFEYVPLSEVHGVLEPLAEYVANRISDFHVLMPMDDWRFSSSYLVESARWFILALFISMLGAIKESRRE